MLLSATAFAQKENPLDSLVREKNKFLPTGIRVGTDVIGFVRTQTDKSFSGYEFNAEIDFYRYYLAAEMGRWERDFTTDSENYSNEGNYFRVGVDVNFLKKDPDKNVFFIGARYGWGTYSETLSIATINDPIWPDNFETYSNNDLKANWGELTTGLRVKMWSFFWMGFTARYKFALNTNETGQFTSHDVPGYGQTSKESTWGFNYLILFRIPVRKQPTLASTLLEK